MGRSRIDSNHIFQHAFDDKSESLKAKIVDTEMEFSLDEKHDSVEVVAPVVNFRVAPGDEFDVSDIAAIRFFVDADRPAVLDVLSSPEEAGDEMWIQEAQLNVDSPAKMGFDPIAVMARRMKIECDDLEEIFVVARRI